MSSAEELASSEESWSDDSSISSAGEYAPPINEPIAHEMFDPPSNEDVSSTTSCGARFREDRTRAPPYRRSLSCALRPSASGCYQTALSGRASVFAVMRVEAT